MHLPTQAYGVRLSEVIPNGHWLSSEERRISSCCIEPEQCQQGDLFVAFDDRHTESSEAIEKSTGSGIFEGSPMSAIALACHSPDSSS